MLLTVPASAIFDWGKLAVLALLVESHLPVQ